MGWSPTRATSAVCQLRWDAKRIHIDVKRYRADVTERAQALKAILDQPLLAVALDGPLQTGLTEASTYRYAERLLTAKLWRSIGKPGQSSSANGKCLSRHAMECASILVGSYEVGAAEHIHNIHTKAVVEAFPTSFLGVMLADPTGLKSKKRSSSDIFFERLTDDETLVRLLDRLLPDRMLVDSLSSVRNHDDRAAIVCAITALCVAANDYTTVGDNDGWIILPPLDFVQTWASDIILQNVESCAAVGVTPRTGRKLGLFSGLHPTMSLEAFDAANEEIAALFYGDHSGPVLG